MIGECDAKELNADLAGSVRTVGDTSYHDIVDMDNAFQLRPSHLVELCDAVLAAELDPLFLQQIGFCIIASDHFEWIDSDNDDRLSATLHHWAAPEINHPLSMENVQKWKHLLETGNDPF